MKILVTDIVYSEKTREWNISIDAIAGWKQYSEDKRTDKSLWSFGNFMEMNTDLPTEFVIDVPFTDIALHIDEVERIVKSEIKRRTTREAASYKIVC